MHSESSQRPGFQEAIQVLDSGEISSTQEYKKETEINRSCNEILQGTIQHLLSAADYDRSDRLFPSDPKLFVTNPLSISYGACGVAWALKKISGGVPPQVMDWILRHQIDAASYPPGLYFGLAGIAWAFKEMGLDARADEILRMSWDHPLLPESPDMFYGLAGWGTAQLRFFLDSGNDEYLEQALHAGNLLCSTAKEENGKCYWSQAGGAVPIGWAHGASGISIFLLYLYLVTSDEKFLEMGRRALDFDVTVAVRNPEGALSWQARRAPTAPGVPYLRYGSAGVGMALTHYYRVLGESRYLDTLEELLPDTSRKYAIYPGHFIGLAGIGEFLVAAQEIEPLRSRCSEALQRVLSGIELFAVRTPTGVAFPGYELYRFSCDFGTGSAGIALFLHNYLTQQSGDFFLTDLLVDSHRGKPAQDAALKIAATAPSS